jgi:hypothetical protein
MFQHPSRTRFLLLPALYRVYKAPCQVNLSSEVVEHHDVPDHSPCDATKPAGGASNTVTVLVSRGEAGPTRLLPFGLLFTEAKQ